MMGETNQNERIGKKRIGRKGRIVILSACLAVLIAGAGILIYVLSKKPPENALLEAVITTDWGTVEYRFEYGRGGRLVRMERKTVSSGTTSTGIMKIKYFQGGCGICRYSGDQTDSYSFFSEDPTIYSREGRSGIDYYDTSWGRLTKVKCKEVDYGIDTWSFDSDGRAVKKDHNDILEERRYTEEYQYDDKGRVIRITRGNNVGDVIYEGNRRIVRFGNSGTNGTIDSEYEYDGLRQIGWTLYKSDGTVFGGEKYYYPKGNFPMSGPVVSIFSQYDAEEFFYCKEKLSGDPQTPVATVEFAPDGQPLRVIEPDGTVSREYTYDTNGMLCSMIRMDAEGNILAEYSYEFDENGNLTHLSSKDGKTDYRFKWS